MNTHDGCKAAGACAFGVRAIRPHETFEITGLPPGTYPYHCTRHSIMGLWSKAFLSRPHPSDFQGVVEKINGFGGSLGRDHFSAKTLDSQKW
jgi:hypothetical protein